MLVHLEGRDPTVVLEDYHRRRLKAFNWRGHALRERPGIVASHESAFQAKNEYVLELLRSGVAHIRLTGQKPTDLSIWIGTEPAAHVPASIIPPDLDARILKELSDMRVVQAA